VTEAASEKIHPDDEMMSFSKNKHGTEKNYFKNGRVDSEFFVDAIKRHKPLLLKSKKVLDFGCGHGRITRYLLGLLNPSKLVVSDVWDSAVDFCAQEFNAIPFLISNENPISNLNTKVDVIISYSVFSHLPPQLFENNLKHLSSLLDKNGLLLFTVKGERIANELGLSLKNDYYYGGKKNHTDGRLSPKEYSLMCVSQVFVEKMLSKVGLRLLEYVKNGKRQDLYVVEPIQF